MEQELTIEETGPDFLLETLEHYLESAEFSDVVLVSEEGEQLPAHRAVISAVSELLRATLLEYNMAAEDGPVKIHFPGIGGNDLYAFLQLAYCGTIDIRVSRKTSIVSLLQMLLVTGDIVINDDPVIDIAVPTASNESHGDITDEDPNLLLTTKKSTTGSCSLLRVDKSGSPFKTKGTSSPGVTVEFQPAATGVKRPAVDISKLIANLSPVKKSKVSIELAMSETKHDYSDLPELDGIIADKLEADRKTRETLDTATEQSGSAFNRKMERCQCPMCITQQKASYTGKIFTNLHVCHYADCGKKYKKTSHLRAHLRWHIGDQPFVCSWTDCGKRFTRSDELHRHFRIHTGEKNHKCQICRKCFSRSDHLKKHLMSHAAAGHTEPFTPPFPNIPYQM